MKLNASYLSEWETQAIEKLKPLVESETRLYFPFFANTLPLAFHYKHALSTLGVEDPSRIELVEWGRQGDILTRPVVPTVCYASLDEVSRLRRQFSSKDDFTWIEIGKYTPRYVFAQIHLLLLKQRNLLSEERNLTNPKEIPFKDIAPFIRRWFDVVEVFTDIGEQAEALLEPMLAHDSERHNVHLLFLRRESISRVFDDTHWKKKYLRIFLFGAPLTWYLENKSSRYIAFQIEPERVSERKFRTVVAVQGAGAWTKIVCTAVETYHKLLFEAADQEATGQYGFRALQYYYNRLARLIGHRSYFSSSQEYARCIREHQIR